MPRPFPKKNFCLWLLALALLVPSGPAHSRVGLQPPAPLPSAARLNQVQQQIESHQEKIEESQIKALNLEQELNRIASQIAMGQETLRGLQEQLHRQEALIQQKERQTEAIQAEKEAIAGHIKKRLAAFYQTGEVGIINALFSATNLGDLLNLQEYVQTLFQYDQQVLQGYREQIALQAKAKDELTQAKEQLQALIGQVQEGESALLKSQQERDQLLAQARAEEDLYRQALKELEAAAAKLIKTITKARALEVKANRKLTAHSQSRPQTRTGASLRTGFAAKKGQLQPPASGRVIRGFGPYKDRFGSDLHADGIDLGVPPKTLVTAIHAGRVIFAEHMPSYGNLVIIDHGEQYYSLVSGLDSLIVMKDDTVKAADVIGTFGQPTGLVNPGLHVEIRHGSTPVDPLLWLEKNQLEGLESQTP